MSHPRKPSAKLTRTDVQKIKELLDAGWYQNRIAALFDVNQGRISEIKTGKYPLG